MISVRIKTKGHRITPAVMSKLNLPPNMFNPNGSIPKDFSKEKIFAPINSATMALVKKTIPKTRNRLFFLELKSVVFDIAK
jgi:hypothetical protein